MIKNIAKAIQGRAKARIINHHQYDGRMVRILDHTPEHHAVKVGFLDGADRLTHHYTMVGEDRVELVAEPKPVKLSPKMTSVLEHAAERDEALLGANRWAASYGYVLASAGSATLRALQKRGLVTYMYGTKGNPRPWPQHRPVLTVAGWAVVRPEGRPADGGRMTLDEALEDAYNAA